MRSALLLRGGRSGAPRGVGHFAGAPRGVGHTSPWPMSTAVARHPGHVAIVLKLLVTSLHACAHKRAILDIESLNTGHTCQHAVCGNRLL
jgi:hypothetical protein